MIYKYGEFSDNQMKYTKKKLQKEIYFLLLIVDPKTKEKYVTYNVDNTFLDLLYKIGGMNSILNEPPELIMVMSYLQRAWEEYQSESFSFKVYRKLILDAGNKIMEVKEG